MQGSCNQSCLVLIFRLMLASHRPVTVNFFFHRARLVNGKEKKDGLEIRHNSLIHHQLSLARSPAHDGDAHDGDDAPRPPRPVLLLHPPAGDPPTATSATALKMRPDSLSRRI